MALRAHCTKSIAIIATVFFGFSSAAAGTVAVHGPGDGQSMDIQTLGTPFQSDNPYDPGDDQQIWRDQIIDLFKLIRARLATQTATAMAAGSGATTADVVEESEQLQFDYDAYGIKQDLTTAERDEFALDLFEALELLSEDPGVLTPDQRDSLAQTLNAMLAEVSN